MHDREHVYRLLWEYVDRNGILTKSQFDISKEIGIPYQKLSEIVSEFVALGRVRKYKHKFQFVNPNSFKWGQDYKDERKKLTDL